MRRIVNTALLVLTAILCVALSFYLMQRLSDTNEKNAQYDEMPSEESAVNVNEEQEKPEPVAEQEPEPEHVPEVFKVSFAAVGDNIIHDTVLSAAKKISPDYDFKPMYENVADIISGADIAYINQESPFAGQERVYSGYPLFNSPDKVGYDLVELGFDVINLANNHMLDRGTSGYRRTVEFWKQQKDVTYIGGFESKEDYDNIRVIEKNGITMAFLSYTYGINLAFDGSDMYVPVATDAEIDRQTRLARELADVVIVSVHWGREHWNDNLEPDDVQKRQMQIMADNGVDVVIGTHPHTLEKMMWHENDDGTRMLVMYSLGNFLSNMEYMRNHVGGIALFDVVKTEDGTSIENVSFVPTVCHIENDTYSVMKLWDYTEDMLIRHGRQVEGPDSKRNLEYLWEIVDKTISSEFLTYNFYQNDSGVTE